MRAQTLQNLVRCSAPAAGMALILLAFLLIAGIALAQQNAAPPQLKTVPEEAPNDPYYKSESGDQPASRPQKPSSKGEGPTVEEWRGEAQKLLDTLGKMLKSIPTYETPTVDENGDIIIRRRPPEKKPETPKSSPDGKTYGT